MNTINAVATAPKTRDDFKGLLERFYTTAFGDGGGYTMTAADLTEYDLNEDIQEHLDIADYEVARGISWSNKYDNMIRVAKEEYDLELQ
jgi:hypothetical protein